MRALIIGCGYIGLPVGAALVRDGHEVVGMNRGPANAEAMAGAGLQPFQADLTRPEDLRTLPGPFDWIINTVSSSKGGIDVYRQVFLEGTRHLLEWLQDQPPQLYVCTSSTSVYGQTDGTTVDESSPTEPVSETGQVLVATEQLLKGAAQSTNFPAVILRVAGIYGPDRGYLFQKYLRDEATIPGEGKRLINMIHQEDVVAIIRRCLDKARGGSVFNCADDAPVTQREFYEWLSQALKKPMPPFVDKEDRTGRKRAITHKKVSNQRLKNELDYSFIYPTFREGYQAEINRLSQRP